MFKEYLLLNWPLILILLAFTISLNITVFLKRKTVVMMSVLIVFIFLLSIVVYLEFHFAETGEYQLARKILMAIRYSATPFIMAQVILALAKKQRWFILLPAVALLILDIVSIPTGIVFSIADNAEHSIIRGPLGYVPYIITGLYCAFLIYILFVRSNKRFLEIIPIAFLGIAFISGLVFPFIFGADFSKIFCTTIALALYVYHEFSIHQITKVDSLTGLLNRAAYFADVSKDKDAINALVNIDMNGLKVLNDTEGHLAGDEALITLALCFNKSCKRRQSAYRLGGDEFMIICRKNTEDEVKELIERIKKSVGATKYSCSVGYSYSLEGKKTIDEMVKESDQMMYEEKQLYYQKTGKNRRKE